MTSLLYVYFVHIVCCWVRLVVFLLCWFTCNKIDVFVSLGFVYRFNVKRYYTVSIFVTVWFAYEQIFTKRLCVCLLVCLFALFFSFVVNAALTKTANFANLQFESLESFIGTHYKYLMYLLYFMKSPW